MALPNFVSRIHWTCFSFSSSNWIDKDEVNFQPHIRGPFSSYVYRLDVSKCESRALGIILGSNDPSGHFVGREILKFRE
jgi:hypothetical protein